jgi:hypothetical protein
MNQLKLKLQNHQISMALILIKNRDMVKVNDDSKHLNFKHYYLKYPLHKGCRHFHLHYLCSTNMKHEKQ